MQNNRTGIQSSPVKEVDSVSRLRDCACITGIGQTDYSRASARSELQLAVQAARAALADAGVAARDVTAIVPYTPGIGADEMAAQLGMGELAYAGSSKMGGASAVASLLTACMLIDTGIARHVLLFCARNGRSGARVDPRSIHPPGTAFRRDFEHPYGAMVPAQWYAMIARRHMFERGSTREDAGALAVQQRAYACLNPLAMMHGRPLTLDEYLAAPPIYDPFHLYDCSLESDGAVAFVVSARDALRGLPQRPVYIGGVAQSKPPGSDDLYNRSSLFEIGLTHAAPRAFAMAGVGPEDMDGAMIYDCVTWIALLQLGEAGFCPRGETSAFLRAGHMALEGRLPVNTHGGLLSEAHLGGYNHVVEGVRQLRGACGARQILDAHWIAVTGWGDLGDGALALLHN